MGLGAPPIVTAWGRAGQLRARCPRPDCLKTEAFPPGSLGAVVCCPHCGGPLRLWEVSTGKRVGDLRGHAGRVRSVAFSPDGRHALSGGRDGRLLLWEVMTEEQHPCARTTLPSSVRSVAVTRDPDSPAAFLLAVGEASGQVSFFRVHPGRLQTIRTAAR